MLKKKFDPAIRGMEIRVCCSRATPSASGVRSVGLGCRFPPYSAQARSSPPPPSPARPPDLAWRAVGWWGKVSLAALPGPTRSLGPTRVAYCCFRATLLQSNTVASSDERTGGQDNTVF